MIFRFLHKPASAERIRNFVDATQRRANGTDLTATLPPRHKNQLFGGTTETPILAPLKLKIDGAAVRRWGRRSLLLVPLLLLGWGLMEWEPWNRVSTSRGPPSAAATDPGEDARVQQMLDAAGLALSQGALIEPPGQNALELYRAVLTRDPTNVVARRGIDSVADELLVQAERALMEQDLTRLASAVDAVRAVRPDHARLGFFVNQLERERAIQGQTGQGVRAVDTLGRPIETPASEQLPSVRVQAFVQLAKERMRSNQLTGKDSAHQYLLSARQLDASDPGVVDGIASLGILYQSNAQKAIRENRIDDASRWLQNAMDLDVDRTQIATMRADIDRPASAKSARPAKLLGLANSACPGRLTLPRPIPRACTWSSFSSWPARTEVRRAGRHERLLPLSPRAAEGVPDQRSPP